jgi:hypothetical protein
VANANRPSICCVADKTLICGIDPGLASGGLVLIDPRDGDRVLDSHSLVERKGAVAAAKARAEELNGALGSWGDREFTAAALRSEDWCLRVKDFLEGLVEGHGPISYFAVESFTDQASRARQDKAGLIRNRWQTPLSIGGLADVLRGFGAEVGNGRLIYQNAGVVLPQWRSELALLESRVRGQEAGVAPDDHLVGNDHERKALVHALALALRLRDLNGNPVGVNAHTPTLEGRHA